MADGGGGGGGAARVEVVRGNLFSAEVEEGDVFMHCVGADLVLGAGIARRFRSLFGAPGAPASVGDVVVQPVQHRGVRMHVIHLVTKPRSRHCRPTRADFEAAVRAAYHEAETLDARRVLAPWMGTGLDRLPRAFVRRVLREHATLPTRIYELD